MADHYYSAVPESAHDLVKTSFAFRGETLVFTTDAGVFSKGELDKGTQLLLETLPPLSGAALDLGCGWGPVGVALKRAYPALDVTMTDVNTRAVALAKENAAANRVSVAALVSEGYQALTGQMFDAIITNPPIRAGKAVIYALFADARQHLTPGGALYLVIRRQQGAESALKYLHTLYPAVAVLDKRGGFWVIQARMAGGNTTDEE